MSEASEQEKQEYSELVKEATPVHSLGAQMLKAFLTGGIICCAGQGILNYAERLGLEKDAAGAWCSVLLVLASVVLTGLNLFGRIARWGGAGALVPITGFANSMVATAIEYKKEGPVLGIGANMFKVAGPVLVCGIAAGTLVGFVCWVLGKF